MVSLEQPSYRVTEGLTANICAGIESGVSDIPVTVRVTAASITAEGQGDSHIDNLNLFQADYMVYKCVVYSLEYYILAT